MPKENAIVSTIIPVFNRPKLILEAVKSVLDQSYRPIEIIVVDDGSTDETPEVLSQLAKRNPELVVVRQKNSGPGAARERGRLLAKGDFIQYLDSDDLVLSEKFRLGVTALNEHPDADIAYGKSIEQVIGKPVPADPKPIRKTGQKIPTLYPDLLVSRWWSTSTPLYRKSLVDKIGAWQNLINEEDWEYDARAAALGVKLVHCPEFVSIRRFHKGEQLHTAGDADPDKLLARAVARKLMLQHAVKGGHATHSREFQHFCKSLFMLTRQCSAAGLDAQASSLLKSCSTAYRYARLSSTKLRLYKLTTILVGHQLSANLIKRLAGEKL